MTAKQVPKLLKTDPQVFASLVNAALTNPLEDLEFILSQISEDGQVPQDLDVAGELKWGREHYQGASNCSSLPPPVVEGIEPLSRAAFPFKLRNAEYYASHRTVLVGDAAHTVHPLAGQGLNMGLGDVEKLAQLVEDAAYSGDDIGTFL